MLKKTSGQNKNLILGIIIFFQVIFLFTWAFKEESKLVRPSAKTILVETIPSYPRKHRKDHFVLAYKMSFVSAFKNQKEGEVFAVLKEEGQYYVPDYLSKTKPHKIKSNQVVIKGFSNGWKITYGIEKYFTDANTRNISQFNKTKAILNIDDNFAPTVTELQIDNKKCNPRKYHNKITK